MHSPPKEPIPVYGLSHSTGEFLCGQGANNPVNIADFEQVWGDINSPDGEPTKGKIYLYISDLNPSVVDIFQLSFVANICDTVKCQTLQDLVIILPFTVSSFCIYIYIGFPLIYCIFKHAYHLLVHDEDDWCAQGHNESIINCTLTAEDYIKWMKDENDKYVICILGVSVLISFLKFLVLKGKISDNF